MKGPNSAKSFYDILGVPKTASDKEIKKAYRKLAIRHHPDKHAGKGEEEKKKAEESFKEISKAYQTLSNTDEKAIYDQYGEAGLEMGAGPNAGSYGFQGGMGGANPFFGGVPGRKSPFQSYFSSSTRGTPGGKGFRTEGFSFGQDGNIDLSELLRQMMGGQDPGTGNRPSTPSSYTRPVRCTLEDLAKGTTKKMKMKFRGREKIYTIKVKPGWKAGTKITFKGSVDVPSMIFQVEEIPHKFLQRNGDDLHFVCWLDESQLKGGIEVNVPLPTGETYKRKIPKAADQALAVIANGEKLVIPQMGMPIKGGPDRGDLVIEFRVRRSATTKAR
jgi:DnaJ-class molecular chaperone